MRCSRNRKGPRPNIRRSASGADIAASIKELKHAGVVFEDYDFPGLKTENHVCVLGAEKAAWFKDTEGNVLCIHEDLPQA